MPTLRKLDQMLLWLAILLLVAAAWGYLLRMADSMAAMPTMAAAINMTTAMESGTRGWQAADFANMLMMWTVMMVAMMVPTAVRTLMIYNRLVRRQPSQTIAPVVFFLTGYLIIWTGFSVAVTALQWLLDSASLLSPMLRSTSHLIGATLLIVAGSYQLTPWKQRCLQHCRSPVGYISEHFQAGRLGATRMGLQHGLFCLVCCWALMLLLFVAGVMDLLWILLITAFVLLEKLLPVAAMPATLTRYISGCSLIATGIILLLR